MFEIIEESPLYKEIATSKFLEGEAKGKLEGKLEGEAKGKLEGVRNSLFYMTQVFFPALVPFIKEQSALLTKEEDLQKLMVLLPTIKDEQEMRQAVLKAIQHK